MFCELRNQPEWLWNLVPFDHPQCHGVASSSWVYWGVASHLARRPGKTLRWLPTIPQKEEQPMTNHNGKKGPASFLKHSEGYGTRRPCSEDGAGREVKKMTHRKERRVLAKEDVLERLREEEVES